MPQIWLAMANCRKEFVTTCRVVLPLRTHYCKRKKTALCSKNDGIPRLAHHTVYTIIVKSALQCVLSEESPRMEHPCSFCAGTASLQGTGNSAVCIVLIHASFANRGNYWNKSHAATFRALLKSQTHLHFASMRHCCDVLGILQSALYTQALRSGARIGGDLGPHAYGIRTIGDP